MNTTFNRERFEKLIAAVEAAPDERFDMETFAERKECGTSACAAGHYVIANPDCGICIHWHRDFPRIVPADAVVTDENRWDFDSFAILAAHFGIGQAEAERLFLSDHYAPEDWYDDHGEDEPYEPNRHEVIATLKEFLAEKAA